MGNDDQERKVSAQDEKDDKHASPSAVDTGGGAYTGGNVNTGGGHFIGRDKIIYEAPKPHIPLERPPRAAHFQDRKDALDKLIIDLRPGQVITVCGPGGIGKSALAAEAVWHLAPGAEPPEHFPDGILFHDFKKEPKVNLAFEYIARSFGVELKSPLAAAKQALAGRLVLLIFDSAEDL